MKHILLFIFIGLTPLLKAQSSLLEGYIEDQNGEPIITATIYIKELEKGVVSDLTGHFSIQGLSNQEYHLSVSALGYTLQVVTVKISAPTTQLKVVLETDIKTLSEVVVIDKSKATAIREQAYAVEVVASKAFKNLSTSANDILGKVSGVNIRQSGGVGSDFQLSLNGLSNNQVRVFLDGVPMDYFGSSLSLNNFSANIIDRIEVYKGVVPIHLSSDALGGAINVVTNTKRSNYLDVSYALGSFNTHLASFNAQYRHKKNGFTARIKSFYNYSDNDYKVPIKLVNFDTGKEDEEATWVRRFHDAYNSRMIWPEIGFTNTKWADQLILGIIYSDNEKEIQQPANAIGQAKIPYGEVTTQEKKIITNFSYNKKGLFTDKLSLNTYFVNVHSERISKDTASVQYDWFGNSTPKLSSAVGEIENRKTLLSLKTTNYLANANAEYQLNNNHSLTLNYSLNALTLQGEDPFKAQNHTQFSHPNDVTKQVLATSYTNTLLNEKLKSTLFTKYYDYRIQSIETNYSGNETTPFVNHKNNLGIGISSTYQLNKWQFKASYENATRFPEIIELFGDGLNVIPSPSILPERSNNYNIGLIFNSQSPRLPITVTFNTFIRDAQDFIIPVVQGIKVFHINSGKVLSQGIDLGGTATYKNKWRFTWSGTYLDLRDNNKWKNQDQGTPNSLYKVRLPNVPYLFGNVNLSFRNQHLFTSTDSYSIAFSQNYVHEFYYRWANLASNDKGVVPSQLTSGLEFVYSLQEETFNISLAINNLWDAQIYDNFQQLRPGRNFNIKFRYFIY